MIKDWFFRTRRRILIMSRWLPIIWNDYDFDYNYILIALKHKIERTRMSMTVAERHTRFERNVKKMRVAELLIERILNNDYSYHRRSEFCTCEDPLPNSWVEKPSNCGTPIHEFVSPFCRWCRSCSTIAKEISRENYDFDYLFNHMRKEMRRWWD